MHTFEPTMVEQRNIFLTRLLKSSRNSSPVDMTDKTRRLGMDIAGLLGFGYDLGLQFNEENEFMLTVLDMMTPKSYLYFNFFSLNLVSDGFPYSFPVRYARNTWE